MDSSTALRYAIMSVPVPGAPPRQNAVGAAIGLSFLDSALRLNHIRRLSETLTVTDHRVARRTTEIDVSLAMLDEGQRRATVLSRDLRSASRSEDDDPGPDRVWVPVARIARRSTAPVTIWDHQRRPPAPAHPARVRPAARRRASSACCAGSWTACPVRRPTPSCTCCCTACPRRSGCCSTRSTCW